MGTTSTKRCGGCAAVKPLEEFARHSKRGYQFKCKVCEKAYRQANKAALAAYQHEYYVANQETIREQTNAYYHANKEVVSARQREYSHANRNTLATWRRAYVHERKKTDIQFKLQCTLRSRLHTAVRGKTKGGSAVRDLGCSVAELKTYLESKFQPGMTWDNWARYGWHIDHIIPLSSFDLTDPVQVKVACHYTNLQPLWWRENLVKGASLPLNSL